MMPSELEYLDSACEMTVLPQPNAPGMAQVPAAKTHAHLSHGHAGPEGVRVFGARNPARRSAPMEAFLSPHSPFLQIRHGRSSLRLASQDKAQSQTVLMVHVTAAAGAGAKGRAEQGI